MKLSLVNDLNESSQYRTRFSLSTSTVKDLSEHVFLDMITLWVLFNEYEYAPLTMTYAEKTVRFSNFKQYRQSGTDLYLALHGLTNPDVIDNMTAADNALISRININEPRILIFLRSIQRNSLRASAARQFLQRLERDLKIGPAELRNIRRQTQRWGLLTDKEKAVIYEMINRQYRRVARRSELYQIFKTFGSLETVGSGGRSLARVAGAALGGAGGYMAGKAFGRSLV